MSQEYVAPQFRLVLCLFPLRLPIETVCPVLYRHHPGPHGVVRSPLTSPHRPDMTFAVDRVLKKSVTYLPVLVLSLTGIILNQTASCVIADVPQVCRSIVPVRVVLAPLVAPLCLSSPWYDVRGYLGVKNQWLYYMCLYHSLTGIILNQSASCGRADVTHVCRSTVPVGVVRTQFVSTLRLCVCALSLTKLC